MTISNAVTVDRRVAAEWEPQACVWISWPHNQDTWPSRFDKIPGFFAHWIKLIAESVPVRVLAAADAVVDCRNQIAGTEGIEILDIPTNDCWIRDYGPTFVLSDSDRELSIVNWRYNAWGGKYPPWDLDDSVNKQIASHLKLPVSDSSFCLEGGALEFDGQGRVLTTPNCLVAENRNPGATQTDIANQLCLETGATEIVWIDGGGLDGDDTDGHIDQLARFIDPFNVVAAVTDHAGEPQSSGLQQNYRQLQLWAKETSPAVDVHRLPVPPLRKINGQAVPQSYCNFLRLGVERLLVPTFGTKEDDYAIGLLKDLSGADVSAIDCQDLVWGLGALHCASRDQPLGRCQF
ncbi:MAG: agmatine deiminase family protein [Rubripirellula sp.]|nr:agmatine deiminase family protein [Rubripirellula sp.]